MDETLHIPEIQNTIFSHFDPGDLIGPAPLALKSLAALARTCKSFQRPALEALWRLQTDLVPALQLFPDDVWDVGSYLGKKTFLVSRLSSPPREGPIFTISVSRNFADRWCLQTGSGHLSTGNSLRPSEFSNSTKRGFLRTYARRCGIPVRPHRFSQMFGRRAGSKAPAYSSPSFPCSCRLDSRALASSREVLRRSYPSSPLWANTRT